MKLVVASTLAALAAMSTIAAAHVSISSGPVPADKSSKITFSVGHGCEGADTVGISVAIPAGITGVRALDSAGLGAPTVTKNGANVTAVSWSKPTGVQLDADDGYYDVVIRARVANVPFTTITWTITQTCRTAGGVVTTAVWDQPPGGGGNEAAALDVVPQRTSGWNKFTLAAPLSNANLKKYFADAQIVWSGTAAFSPNMHTMTQIGATTGVTALTTDLASGAEIWVKY